MRRRAMDTAMTDFPTARPVTVAAIQMASEIGNKAANLATAARLIEEANADLAVLPELFATEFFASEKDPRFFDYAEPLDGPTIRFMSEVAARTQTILVTPLFEYAPSGEFFNSAVLIGADGEVIGVYRKTHIPFTKSFEKFYFAPGDDFPVFETPIGRIGILICYDRWFPEGWGRLRDAGAEIVCVPIASWRLDGASEAPWWDALHRMRARENLMFVAASNRTGQEGDWGYIGESLIVSPTGDVLARLDETSIGGAIATIDLDLVRQSRARWPLLRDRRPDIY